MNFDISYFANLPDRDLAREGYMVGEGRLLVARMLESNCEMIGLLCSPECSQEIEALAANKCPIKVLTEKEISQIAGYPFHRGVLAAARTPALLSWTEWEKYCECSFEAKERTEQPEKPPCRIIICPEVSEPENLGSIYRCAGALGWDAVLLGPSCTSPFSRRALRSSMGACLTTLSIRISGPSDLTLLQERGFLILGTSIKESAQELTDLSSQLNELGRLNRDTVPIALIFGNEFHGITPEWEATCKRLVRIPMHGGTDSLNIAVAAGIFMYELGPRLI